MDVWHRARRGLPARVFWAYLAVALVIAMVSPGMAVFADEAVSDQPGVVDPAGDPAQEPVVEPVVEPVTEEPVAEEPVTEEPVAEEPVAEEPVAEEPVVGEPVAAEPVAEEPAKMDAAVAAVQQPLVAAVVAGTVTIPPSDRGVYPIYVSGNPGCTSYTEFKLNGVASDGTYTVDTEGHALPAGASITISDGSNYTFDFSASGITVHSVIVKAASGANVYLYGATGVSSDGNLWTVMKADASGFHDISHITFCWSDDEPEYEGKIKVHKFNDNDPTNGSYDDEPMLKGWEFILKDAAGTDLAHGFTGNDGTYTFRDLALGTYYVEEVLKPGWTNTTGLSQMVVLAAPTTAASKCADCDEPDPIVVRADVWFGNVRTPVYEGKIKVHKFHDNDPTNQDHDAGEAMLEGWEFILRDAQMAEITRGTTGADGTFTFGGLALGTYYVEEVLKPGWINTTGLSQMVVLAAPTTAASKCADCDEPDPILVKEHVWFGNVEETYEGTIVIHKYNDNDPTNGAYDDEEMLEGWVFILKNAAGQEVARGTTGPDGTLSFMNLPLGTYYVEEVLTPGWLNTTGLSQMVVLTAPVYTGKYADIAVGPRPVEVLEHAWFGNVRETYEGEIVVHKYNDNDPTNAAFDDEPMLEGWEFILRDAQMVELERGTTGPDGTFTFGGLELGTYYVEEVLQAGWVNTTGLIRQVVLTEPVYTKAAMTVGALDPVLVTGHAWFGNVRESYIGKIVVHKFHDNDPQNGEYDDEEMLEGWEFILKNAEGSAIATGTTGADGTLEFANLPLGTYTVEEVLRDGWDNTTPLIQTVVLTAPVYDAIGERVFEPPLPVEIVGHAWFGNVREVYEKSFELTYAHKPAGLDSFKVTFWLNGEYHDLPLVLDDDAYKASIEVVHPYEIADVTWWAHGPDGWIWLGSVYGTEVLEGDLTNYFHYDPSLSGYKYADLDGDGIWGEEPAIPGWTIYLYRLPDPQRVADAVTPPPGAVLVAQTVTDENGHYEFTGMLPGLYYIVEEERPGWTPTEWPEDQPIMIENETHVSDLNFGNMPPAEKTFELTFIDAPEDLDYLVRYWIEGEAEPHELELVGDNPFSGSVEVTVGTTFTSIEWIAVRDEEEFVLGTTGPETIEQDLLNQFEYRSHIGGYKFDDEDGEGDWDEGEPPIEGWKITLYREVSSPPIEVDLSASAVALIPIAETFTDGEGYYEFNGLLPGTYLVQEEDREGWEMTLSPDGTFVVENGTDRDDLIFGNTEFLPFTELDLAITKLADVEWADPGDVITYTLTYWNNGEEPATNFTIVDDYDERYLTVVNAAGGVVSGGKITWSLPGPLAMEDGKKTIVYTMRVIADMPDGTTNLDNTVEIKHPRDTDPSNNKDDERVRVKVGDEPFLPFTGSEYLMLLAAAVVAGAAGVALRVRASRTT